MKVVSYTLFGDPYSFEFPFYLRGIYFNIRMNRLLYPDWRTIVHVEKKIHHVHTFLLNELKAITDYGLVIVDEAPRCEAMLWRMKPIFTEGVTHVICRDADAITTYREAQAVSQWTQSRMGFHGITDDPAHSIPMMGGMCGFKTDAFKAMFPEYANGLNLSGDFSNHGSDQNWLMKHIYPRAKEKMMGHFFKGTKEYAAIVVPYVDTVEIPGVSPRLWESNLTCRMIGSPGVVDFELLRFFSRFDKNERLDKFEKQYSDTFYWAK